MPVEIREITIKANIHTSPQGRGGQQVQADLEPEKREELVAEIANRVMEVIDRKKGR